MDIDDVFAPNKVEQEYKRTCQHMEFVREYWTEVTNIKELIANNQDEAARGVFYDVRSIPVSVRIGLWRATTKGGCWTVEERRVLKPNESTEQ